MHNGRRRRVRVRAMKIYKQGNHQTKRRHASYFLWLQQQQEQQRQRIFHDTLLSINKRTNERKVKRCTEEHNKNVKMIFCYFGFCISILFEETTTTINYQHKQDMKFVAKASAKEIHKRHLKWQASRCGKSHGVGRVGYGRREKKKKRPSLLTPTALLRFPFLALVSLILIPIEPARTWVLTRQLDAAFVGIGCLCRSRLRARVTWRTMFLSTNCSTWENPSKFNHMWFCYRSISFLIDSVRWNYCNFQTAKRTWGKLNIKVEGFYIKLSCHDFSKKND